MVFGFFAIGQNGAHITMSVSVVGGSKGRRGIVAGEYAAAIGRQQYTLRVARIDKHIIHHDFGPAHPLPVLALVDALPQTFGRAGINDRRIAGILLQHAGSPRGERECP
jgi:hypothetical protein